MSLLLYPHVKAIFFNADADLGLADGHFRKGEVTARLAEALAKHLARSKVEDLIDYSIFSEQLFDDLIEAGVIISEEQKFAGAYYRRKKSTGVEYRKKFLEDDVTHNTASRIGPRYYPDVFDGFRRQLSLESQLETPIEIGPLVTQELVEGVDWGTVEQKITTDGLAEIRDRANQLINAINQSELNERQKANATAHAQAVIHLLEAPDPPWEVIVDLLNNRYFSAILNAAAILQLILGAAL